MGQCLSFKESHIGSDLKQKGRETHPDIDDIKDPGPSTQLILDSSNTGQKNSTMTSVYNTLLTWKSTCADKYTSYSTTASNLAKTFKEESDNIP